MNRIHICQACVNLKNGVKTRIAIAHTCGKSDEEIFEDKKKAERYSKRFKNMLSALKTIKEKKEPAGKITCPECGGNLHYTKASSNGHIWGKCQTEGCLAWMQ